MCFGIPLPKMSQCTISMYSTRPRSEKKCEGQGNRLYYRPKNPFVTSVYTNPQGTQTVTPISRANAVTLLLHNAQVTMTCAKVYFSSDFCHSSYRDNKNVPHCKQEKKTYKCEFSPERLFTCDNGPGEITK